MSTSAEHDFDLDLHFLPAWAQQPADKNRYENFTGESERRGSGQRPPRRSGPPRREGKEAPRSRRDDSFSHSHRGQRGRAPFQAKAKPDPIPLPELNVAFVPEDHGVDSMTRQIRMTGRAYPLFEIAKLVLEKPERHVITLSIQKDAHGQPKQKLFQCAIDQTVWLSEDETVRHVLQKHFDLFYKTERTAIEPPKGTYTFVAQCGISGVILGPPNYHDYQKQLHKLHTERFSRMPFDAFKARVKIVRDEAVIKKWIEDHSFKTQFTCLNMPEATLLDGMEEVEKHFRSHHLANIVQPVETFHCKTAELRSRVLPQSLHRLVRRGLDEQRRFPLQVMTILSQQFASRGLQFFKVNRTVTHVAVSRPHYLDFISTPVSEGVRRIVDFINQHPKCNRKQLVEALAPSPSPAPTPAPPVTPVAEGSPTPASSQPEPTPEQTAVISDLHWLIHQGHVIEFATGILETAKKPISKPSKPVPSAADAPAPPPPAATIEASPEANAPSDDESADPEPATDESSSALSEDTTETSTVPKANLSEEPREAPAPGDEASAQSLSERKPSPSEPTTVAQPDGTPEPPPAMP